MQHRKISNGRKQVIKWVTQVHKDLKEWINLDQQVYSILKGERPNREKRNVEQTDANRNPQIVLEFQTGPFE